MQPKVSVIILVYRVEAYIERCARSLFAQTLDDIEYIFVNDATPDRSMDILYRVIDDFPQRKSSIRIINNEENRGQAYSRKRGIDAASGLYIIHCDSDDWVDTTLYENLYSKALKEGCDLVWCDFYRDDGITDSVESQSCTLDFISTMKAILCGQKMGVLWNTLVKSDIVRQTNIVYPNMNIMEDVVLMMQYLYYARQLGYIKTPLYHYYNHESSSTMSDNRDLIVWQVHAMDENLKMIFCFLKIKNLYKYFHKEVIFRKFFNKRWLLPVIKNAKDCRLWIKEYPEINRSLFFNSYINISDKLTALLVEMRIYPYLRKKLRKR
jgi:glycosyltransferase involved in cell wall biosynthesis